MRLFVGLVPSGESLVRIEAGCPPLLPASSRRVPLANLHLTLVFIAQYPKEDVEKLKQVLGKEVFQGIAAFYLQPSRLYWHRNTLWLELREDAYLTELAARLHQLLDVPFRRPFRAHVTLARLYSSYRLPLGSYPLRMGEEPLFFPEAYLFQSHLSRAGAVYERLARYPLLAASNLPL